MILARLWFLKAWVEARTVHKALDHPQTFWADIASPALSIFVGCLLAWETYLLVYEWISPQLALLPAQQHPIPSLGFPPTAGLGYLLTVQRQQPKHRGQLEVFRSINPTAAKLEESRMWELE